MSLASFSGPQLYTAVPYRGGEAQEGLVGGGPRRVRHLPYGELHLDAVGGVGGGTLEHAQQQPHVGGKGDEVVVLGLAAVAARLEQRVLGG